ncbi:MAG TPA: IclR family transcriptional regulator [Candidatus Dormibacteraeota bacterium]|jgi:DNA-binding IclR family transcriptional regulator|nr:IclR family transcriptional regulator [Candidatus Dormibacteraeota bacterium]
MPPKANAPPRSLSPAIDRALAVLEFISEHPRGQRMIDVARALRLPRSSTHVTLEALRGRGYLERDDGGLYRLGLKVFEITNRFMQGLDLRQVARPHLEELTGRTGLTSNLAVLDGNDVVYIDSVEGKGFVKFDTHVGKRATLNLTAVGKALALHLPEPRLDGILQETFRPGINDAPRLPFEFKNQLDEFRQRGYAVEDEEDVPGICCVAAPVRDGSARVVGSIGVVGIKRDLVARSVDGLGEVVRDAAAAVSRQLGFHTEGLDGAEEPSPTEEGS